jgi:hypothetical protein
MILTDNELRARQHAVLEQLQEAVDALEEAEIEANRDCTQRPELRYLEGAAAVLNMGIRQFIAMYRETVLEEPE